MKTCRHFTARLPKTSLRRLFHLIGIANLRGEVEEYGTWMEEEIKSGSCRETREPVIRRIRVHTPSSAFAVGDFGSSWPEILACPILVQDE
jgi:hypothetical protein